MKKRDVIAIYVVIVISNIYAGYLFYENSSLIRYEGEKNEYGRMSGHGRWTDSDGDVFEGEWVNNRKHGKGVIIFTDGDKCKGIWENGTLVKKLGCENDE